MIVEWLLDIFATVQGWALGLFGTSEPPVWLTSVTTFIADLWARASGLGAWIPWGLFGVVTVSVLGLWAVFWIVKGIRWLYGLTPFSGGS